MVHVTRHLEEVRFMTGEVGRLQQRIAVLEKELAVSDELKVRTNKDTHWQTANLLLLLFMLMLLLLLLMLLL